jgi:hypothetical protein
VAGRATRSKRKHRKGRRSDSSDRPARVECPLCGAQVSALFGLEDHQRGARCRGMRKALALKAEGLQCVQPQVAAALLLDPLLATLLKQDVVGVRRENAAVGSYATVQGYWAPAWMVRILSDCDDAQGIDEVGVQWRGYTLATARPSTGLLQVLRTVARAAPDDLEAYECALMLGGLRALLSMLVGVLPREGGEA